MNTTAARTVKAQDIKTGDNFIHPGHATFSYEAKTDWIVTVHHTSDTINPATESDETVVWYTELSGAGPFGLVFPWNTEIEVS